MKRGCAFCNHIIAADGSCTNCDGFELREEIEIIERKIIGKAKPKEGQNTVYRVKMFRTDEEWDAVMKRARALRSATWDV